LDFEWKGSFPKIAMQNQEKKLDEVIKPNAPTPIPESMHLKIFFRRKDGNKK
jgi:hypothetical protein